MRRSPAEHKTQTGVAAPHTMSTARRTACDSFALQRQLRQTPGGRADLGAIRLLAMFHCSSNSLFMEWRSRQKTPRHKAPSDFFRAMNAGHQRPGFRCLRAGHSNPKPLKNSPARTTMRRRKEFSFERICAFLEAFL
jgi:hypothetical protein